jgi:hypothetical protein
VASGDYLSVLEGILEGGRLQGVRLYAVQLDLEYSTGFRNLIAGSIHYGQRIGSLQLIDETALRGLILPVRKQSRC